MKKIILIGVGVIVLLLRLEAQINVTVLPSSVEKRVTVDLSDFEKEIVLRSRIINTDSKPVTITWEQDVIDQPFEWQADISDQYYYYFLYEDERLKVERVPPITLAPGESFDLTLYVYPRGRADEGAYFFNILSSEGKRIKHVSFYLTVNDRKYEKKKSKHITIYPNPAKMYFELSPSDNIGQINLTNMLGMKVKSYTYKPFHKYDVSSLPNGIYFIEFINKEGGSIKTVRLLVENPRA